MRAPLNDHGVAIWTRIFVACVALCLASCAHHSAQDIIGPLGQFTSSRDRAVAQVAQAKTVLDFLSLSQLDICYSDVGSKANQYSDYIVSVVETGIFDAAQNQTLAHNLQLSIASYDDCLLKLQRAATAKTPILPMSLLETDWVPGFGQSVATYWRRDASRMQALSPDAKAQLIGQIKSLSSWPSFDSITKAAPQG